VEATLTSPPKGVPEEDLNGLFHGPLDEFTSSRNELAKSLRSSDAEAADWVKGLQKPTRAAWLANQLAAREPKDVGRLLEAGRDLRAAQEDMLAGSADREKLRDAAGAEEKAVASLLATAEAIGREHGVGAQVLTKVEDTLRAASADPEVAEALEKGRLQREQRAAGLGGLLGAGAVAAPARGRKKKDDRDAAERRARQQQAKRRKEAERKLATAEKRLERERGKLERAQEAVSDAEKAVHNAELDAHAARRALDEI
jgi:hypothetical protein